MLRQDYFTSGQRQPDLDAFQKYMLQSVKEIKGFTNLLFSRKGDTGDKFYDVEIKVSKPKHSSIYHISFLKMFLVVYFKETHTASRMQEKCNVMNIISLADANILLSHLIWITDFW